MAKPTPLHIFSSLDFSWRLGLLKGLKQSRPGAARRRSRPARAAARPPQRHPSRREARRGVAGGSGGGDAGVEEGRGARDDAPRVPRQHPEPQQVLLPQLRHRLHGCRKRGRHTWGKRGAAGQTRVEQGLGGNCCSLQGQGQRFAGRATR